MVRNKAEKLITSLQEELAASRLLDSLAEPGESSGEKELRLAETYLDVKKVLDSYEKKGIWNFFRRAYRCLSGDLRNLSIFHRVIEQELGYLNNPIVRQ